MSLCFAKDFYFSHFFWCIPDRDWLYRRVLLHAWRFCGLLAVIKAYANWSVIGGRFDGAVRDDRAVVVSSVANFVDVFVAVCAHFCHQVTAIILAIFAMCFTLEAIVIFAPGQR